MYLNGDAKADVVLDATVVVVVVDGAAVVDVVITPKIKFCLPASEGLPFTRKYNKSSFTSTLKFLL